MAKKVLGDIESYYKFLIVPKEISKDLPEKKGRLNFKIDGNLVNLLYLPKYRKICGLTFWYKKHNLKKGSEIEIKISAKVCNLIAKRSNAN